MDLLLQAQEVRLIFAQYFLNFQYGNLLKI